MIVPFLAGVFLLRPVHFPPQPIQHEIERGIEVYRQGKGLERVLMEDRQIVGWWFNGKIKEGVEEVVWISPSLVSRWLGYLWAQEKWAGGELERRYGRLRARLRGQMWFMTRLSRLPKMDFLGEEEPPRPMSFKPEPVRLLFTTGADLPSPSTSFRLKVARRLGEPEPEFEPHEGLRVALAPVGLAEISGREWGALKGFPWYLTTHLLQELWPEFEEPACEVLMGLGRYHSGFFLASMPVPRRLGPTFEVRVFSPGKERVARFDMLSPRPLAPSPRRRGGV